MSKRETYYTQKVTDVLAELASEPGGLDSQVAKSRLDRGANTLPTGSRLSAAKLFFGQFKDALIIVLIIAATVSLGVSYVQNEGLPTEALLIYGIVLAIAVVGFLNEYKAEKTVAALKKLVSQTCQVRRDGEVMQISTKLLVPGDIVLLDEGKKVPADIRIITASHLQINEASLTGESTAVSKHAQPLKAGLPLADQRNMLFSGTIVAAGTAEGVVVATGANTMIGHIATLVSQVKTEDTPMQRKLNDLGRRIGLVITVICVVVFIIILLGDSDLQKVDLLQRLLLAFTAAVALAVAAIPEGLAFVVRISLALGARRMANKNALVRKLSAVESLGSTDIICCDKTGTLTKGEMTVRHLFAGNDLYELTGSGYGVSGELRLNNSKAVPSIEVLKMCEIGLLCNNASLRHGKVLGDPTEGCLIVSATKIGLNAERINKNSQRLREIPFSADRKMMSTLHQAKSGVISAVKGAPTAVLGRCTHILQNGKTIPITAEHKKHIIAQDNLMASRALRVLGFAYRDFASDPGEYQMERGLTFVGLQAMMDPPRIEVKQTINRVQSQAGIRVVMITGDNIETAKAVAREIGIAGDAITGAQLDKLNADELKSRIDQIGVYARVNPEHKIRIVQALKAKGHQVAMTGDGVNDAPAIKAADVGIAMGITGTDAAKEASDLILLDDRFITIVAAIEEGRGIFDNVRKSVNFLLSCNIAEVITVLFGILLYGNLVLTAAQLLFINIVTDGLPAVALGSDPASPKVMSLGPRYYQQQIITKRVWVKIGTFGVLMSGLLLWQYSINLQYQGAALATSAMFLGMVVYEFVRVMGIRTDYRTKLLSNPLLLGSILISLAIQAVIIYWPPLADIFKTSPLGPQELLFIAGGGIGLFLVMRLINPLLDRIPDGPLPKRAIIKAN